MRPSRSYLELNLFNQSHYHILLTHPAAVGERMNETFLLGGLQCVESLHYFARVLD